MKTKILVAILVEILAYAMSFGITQLLYWGICMCFSLNYVFLHGVGIWLTLFALNIAFGK